MTPWSLLPCTNSMLLLATRMCKLTPSLQEEFGALTPKQMAAKMAILQQAVREVTLQCCCCMLQLGSLIAERLVTDTSMRCMSTMDMHASQAQESHKAAVENKKQSSGSNLTLETDW
jgi:hypothetical protein